ncbi:MAG: DUF305 domain-containing protein [Gemmatimonadales bacterium]
MTTYAPGRRTAALLLLAVSACAPAARGPAASAPEPRASASDARAQADSVRRSYTAADVQFMTHMIGHHAQAIAMARWAPTHGANPSVRILAERIINAQQDEIATMQQWLRVRHQPVPEAKPAGVTMMTNGVEHVMLMPGMLTDDQMKQLDAARGPDFDRRFLTFMIQHHQGALTMVDQLFGSHGAAQEDMIFKLASDVSADQSTEVARMQTMLAAMPPETRSSR